MSRQVVKVVAYCAAIVLTINVSAEAAQPLHPENIIDSDTYTHPNRLVRIDETRRLNILCMGSGAPTVILDSGAGVSLYMWRQVQKPIAGFTRVCAYDRAGLGFSDPASRPSDAVNAVDDLHRLVHAAGIHTPVILVGHSIAGLYAVLYADRYRKEVAGLVLVDPAVAGQWQHFYAVDDEQARKLDVRLKLQYYKFYQSCLALAFNGILDRSNGAVCLDDLNYGDPALQMESDRQESRLKTVEATFSEQENAISLDHRIETMDEKEIASYGHELGRIPLIVLKAGRIESVPPRPAEDAVRATDLKSLAHYSSIGRYVVVANAGHDVPNDAPDSVVNAVREVVKGIRHTRLH